MTVLLNPSDNVAVARQDLTTDETRSAPIEHIRHIATHAEI